MDIAAVTEMERVAVGEWGKIAAEVARMRNLSPADEIGRWFLELSMKELDGQRKEVEHYIREAQRRRGDLEDFEQGKLSREILYTRMLRWPGERTAVAEGEARAYIYDSRRKIERDILARVLGFEPPNDDLLSASGALHLSELEWRFYNIWPDE